MTHRKFYRFTIAVSLLLLLLSQIASAADWLAIRSGNLFITGQAAEADLRLIAQRVERFRSALGTLSPRLRDNPAHPVKVLVFPDDPAFSSFGLKRADGTFDEAVAGYFVGGEDANFIAITGKPSASTPYHTIFHEYVHNLLRPRGSGEVPAWLNEGLAQYLETAEFTADGKVVLGSAPKGRLELLERSEFLPLRKLLSATNEQVHSGGTPRTVFYAQSWLLVHYLLSNVPGSSFKDRLEKIFELSADHSTIEKLVGDKGSGLENILRIYAAARPGTRSYELAPEDPPLPRDLPEQMTPGAADALLGELLLRLGRQAEAEVLVRRSIAAEKTSLQANCSLGEILAAKGKYAEARASLETAERAGELGPGALFNLAYSLVKETGDRDQLIGKLPSATADRARGYLKRSIELRPSFVEPYKLLAHISLINNDQLQEAAPLLSTAIALRPGDAALQLMLAKTYLQLEKYQDASATAAAILSGPASSAIKKEALDVQNASSEFIRTSLQLNASSVGSAASSILFLKRSWLTDDDIKQVELNRELSNLNIALDRPRPGELQIVGSIDKIACSDGEITYTVLSDGTLFKLTGSKFADLRLSVLVEGMHSFKLECGAAFAGQKAVLLYKPADATINRSTPQLTSVAFVPENFQLMSPNQRAARTVIVEDDMLRRGRQRDGLDRYTRVSDTERFESIKSSLRKPLALENQIIGRIDGVDCSTSSPRIRTTAGDKEWQFTAPTLKGVAINWFTSQGLNFRLTCETDPTPADVLLTYKPNTAGGPHELTAIEFIPTDLPSNPLRKNN